jgi:hypothetical protein
MSLSRSTFYEPAPASLDDGDEGFLGGAGALRGQLREVGPLGLD